MFPASLTSRPARRSMSATSVEVVDFPLVPVTATTVPRDLPKPELELAPNRNPALSRASTSKGRRGGTPGLDHDESVSVASSGG